MAHKRRPRGPVVLDFFAGCGGLSLGLEQAGFYPVYVNELNGDALRTYLINRIDVNPQLERFSSQDVKTLLTDEQGRPSDRKLDQLLEDLEETYGLVAKNGDIDLVVGGPPCQGYSGIGHRRSYAVDKVQLPSNHLYKDYERIVRKLTPKLFLFENVKGLLSARWSPAGEKGEIWLDVLDTFRGLKDAGYSIAWNLVHAKDYGVPQNRPRVLLVGVRDDVGEAQHEDALESGLLPAGTGGAPDLIDLLGDLVDPNFKYGRSTSAYPSRPLNSLQEILRLDPEGSTIRGKGAFVSEQEYSNHSAAIREKFRHMLTHEGRIPPRFQTKKFAQRLLPARWGSSGPTITATSLPDDYVHFSQARILTVREWARLQCFPDWYEFYGKRTTGGLRRAGNPREGVFDRELPKYTQIGNAVPVWLARAIGEHFRDKVLQVKR